MVQPFLSKVAQRFLIRVFCGLSSLRCHAQRMSSPSSLSQGCWSASCWLGLSLSGFFLCHSVALSSLSWSGCLCFFAFTFFSNDSIPFEMRQNHPHTCICIHENETRHYFFLNTRNVQGVAYNWYFSLVCGDRSTHCNPLPFFFGGGEEKSQERNTCELEINVFLLSAAGKVCHSSSRNTMATLHGCVFAPLWVLHSLAASFSYVSTVCWLLCAAGLWRHCLADSCFKWQKELMCSVLVCQHSVQIFEISTAVCLLAMIFFRSRGNVSEENVLLLNAYSLVFRKVMVTRLFAMCQSV